MKYCTKATRNLCDKDKDKVVKYGGETLIYGIQHEEISDVKHPCIPLEFICVALIQDDH